MKKTAIITFHRAMNCGAMLQAYALQQILSTKYYTDILDYRCEEIEYVYGYKRTLKERVKDVARWILRYRRMKATQLCKKRFIEFSKQYFISSRAYRKTTICEADAEYDVFVAGSDQIWNLKLTGHDWTYFLDFAPPSKRYSYAASFGSLMLAGEDKERARAEFSKFNSLLVREKSGTEILKGLGCDITCGKVVSDPVFLLNKQEWINKLNLTKNPNGYIFIYVVARQTNSMEFARKMAQKTGKPVYYISLYPSECDKSFKQVVPAGPVEFLEYILNADLVITTSFHAMAFSLIFNTSFVYELDKRAENANERLENLAKIFSVEDRELVDLDHEITNDLDWDRINGIIAEYSQTSKDILFESLRNGENPNEQ